MDPFDLLPSPLPLWAATLLVAGGSALVAVAANWLVDASSALALALGIPRMVVGLTIVAAGTSAPEMAVTVLAGLEGHGDIAVANVVGSNIFNLGFILGGVALIRPIRTGPGPLARDGAMLVGSSLLLLALLLPSATLNRFSGIVLLSTLVAYLSYVIHTERAPGTAPPQGEASTNPGTPQSGAGTVRQLAALLGALALILVSARALTAGAQSIAGSLGLSEWVIGMTVVAAGTSLPEFATSLVAALKGYDGLALGNVIGSDIFNILGIIGVAGLLHPIHVDGPAVGALLTLSGVALLTVVMMRTGWKLTRLEGCVLLALAASRWLLDILGG